MRTLVAALSLAAVTVAGLGVPSGGAQSSPSVTLAVFRIYDSGNRIHKFRFSGSISSRAGDQYVAVMQQKCGYSFATAIAGAQTRAGGFWEAETSSAPRPELDTNTYFARWGSAKSKPVKFQGRLSMSVTKLGQGRFRVYVWRGGDVLQDLGGRQIVLQRLNAGRWSRIAVARLRIDPSQYSSYAATFTIRTRGWTLRAVVPTKNARPCFNQSTTERFKS